jgi:hypothetical protein
MVVGFLDFFHFPLFLKLETMFQDLAVLSSSGEECLFSLVWQKELIAITG